MKKFLLCLFSFLFIGTALTGSSFLLAGCDSSYSQEENGEHSDNNESADNENGQVDDDEIEDNIPNEGNDQSGTGENGNNGQEDNNGNDDQNSGQDNGGEDSGDENQGSDEEVGANSSNFNFTIKTYIRTSSSGGYTAGANSNDEAGKYASFDFTWLDNNGNAANLTPNDHAYYPANGLTIVQQGGDKGTSFTYYAKYMYYKWSALTNYKRYGVIYPHSFYSGNVNIQYPSECEPFGVSTSTSNSRCRNLNSNAQYIYGSSNITSNESTAKSSCSATLTGTYYVYFRMKYSLNYYYWSSPGTYYSSPNLSVITYAGVGGTNIYTTANNISGYQFIGWSTTKNGSVSYWASNSNKLVDADVSRNINLYAIYAPLVKVYSYFTTDYSNFEGSSSTGGTFSVDYTNRYGNLASITDRSVFSDYVYPFNNITVKASAKTGYVFSGWYSSIPTASNSPTNTGKVYSFAPNNVNYYALFVHTKPVKVINCYTTDYNTISSGGTGGSIKVAYYNSSNDSTSTVISIASGTILSVYDLDVTLSATAASGYQFVGWYSATPSTSNEATNRLSTSTSYSFTASARSSIYGLFAKTYTLTIKYASGNYTHSTTITATNSTIGLSQTISSGNTCTLTTYCRPNSQTITIARVNGSYTYYMGNGSATTSSATNSFTYSWSTTADATINVYVRERYTITYNGNGNTGGTVPSAVYKAHGTNITLASNSLTKTGYTANGWNPNASGTGTHYDNGASYSGNGNVTLYAQWTANTYVVNFDTANEITYPYGKNQSSTQGTYTTKVENNVLIYEYKVTTAASNGPHAGGPALTVGQQYKWSIDVKCSRAITIKSMGQEMGGVKSNVVVTTSWQTITHTFTATANANNYHAFIFYSTGNWKVGDVFSYKNLSVQKVSGMKADNAIGNLTVTYDGTYASLPTPTRAGYTFAGWYLDSGLTKPVTTSTKVTTASNHTLYSKWTQKQFLVDINVLNPSGEQDYVSGTFDVYYSYTGVTHNDLTDQFTPSTVVYGGTIVISDIKPANGYAVESVYLSTSSGKGTLTSSSGKYTFTANADGEHQVNWYNVINIKMKYATYTMTYNANGGSVKNYNYAARIANVSGNYGGVTLNYNATTQIATLNGTMTESSEITRYYASNFVAGTYTIGYEVVGGSMSRTDGCFVFEFLNSSGSALSTRTYYNYWDDTSTFSATLTLSASMAKETQQFAVWLYRTNNGGYQFNDLQIKVWCYLETPAVTTQKVTYTKATVIPYAVKDGFRFIGWNTKSDGTGVLVGPGNVATLTANTTLYAIYEARNPAYYDEEGDYWYVEMGMFPQTLVKDTTTINALNKASNNSKTYSIAGQTLVTRSYNNDEYCLYNNNWYKVEPVRWRLQGTYTSGQGFENTNVTAVLAEIVYASAWADVELGIGEGYSNSLIDDITFYEDSLLHEWSSGVTDFIDVTNKKVEQFTEKGVQEVNYTHEPDFFASSIEEIELVCGKNANMEMSDLVKAITNNSIKYWTRNLGSTLNTAKTMTTLGMVSQDAMQNVLGVQYTINITEFGCINS